MGNAPLGSAGHEDIEVSLFRNKESEDYIVNNCHNADDEEFPLFWAVDREYYRVAWHILQTSRRLLYCLNPFFCLYFNMNI